MAGIALGFVLLLTFYIMGTGLGASGAVASTAAVASHAGLRPKLLNKINISRSFINRGPLILSLIGEFSRSSVSFLQGLVAVITAKRFKISVGKGATFPTTYRLILAFVGGIVGGIGTRFAMGCTSGQALSGGATMVVGSWVFMMTVFGTAFVAAYFVRKECNDWSSVSQ